MKNELLGSDDKKKALEKWFPLKCEIHQAARMPNFKAGEIWWCIFGENVGVEINGKNDFFLRPVLIFKKFNQYSFFGIPLTSQKWRQGDWYVHFVFQDKNQVAVLNQAGKLSSYRLHNRLGMITKGDLARVKEGFRKLFL